MLGVENRLQGEAQAGHRGRPWHQEVRPELIQKRELPLLTLPFQTPKLCLGVTANEVWCPYLQPVYLTTGKDPGSP